MEGFVCVFQLSEVAVGVGSVGTGVPAPGRQLAVELQYELECVLDNLHQGRRILSQQAPGSQATELHTQYMYRDSIPCTLTLRDFFIFLFFIFKT